MKKKYVLDTSVMLYDPECLSKFGDNEVIIPSVSYEEINRIKEESTERGYYAREISKVLDELSQKGPLKAGTYLGETLIRTSYDIYNDQITKALTHREADYLIIACALNNEATLISRDRMMRVIARDFVPVEEYKADTIQTKQIYNGYQKILVHDNQISRLYGTGLENQWGLCQNEFAILQDESFDKHTAVGICKGDLVIPCDFEKAFRSSKLKLKPVNLEQKMFLYLLMDPDILAISCCGKSGKGKTVLGVDYALSSVQAGYYSGMIYTKSVVAVDEKEELGFYKGGPDEKLKPHLQPLYNSIEFLYRDELYRGKQRTTIDEKVQGFIEEDILRVVPLANVRGMSVFDKVVILDEAQNTGSHMMKTVVTRMGDNAKLIVLGDVEQIDDRFLNKYNNGLTHLIEEGKNEAYIGHITMDLDERSKRGKLSEFGSNKL